MTSSQASEPQLAACRPRVRALLAAGAVAFAALVAASVLAGGEALFFLLAGLQVGPFLVLAVLAQLGQRRAWARVATYLWLAATLAAVAAFVLLVSSSALISLAGDREPAPLVASAGRVALALLASGPLAIALLFRPVRALVARALPIDPDSLVHTVALVFIAYFTVVSFAQLVVLGGRPPILVSIEAMSAADATGGRSPAGQLLDMVYGLAWTIPMAIAGAGFPVRRALRDSLGRLGLTRPSRTHLLVGLSLAIALVVLFNGIDEAISWLWGLLGWPTTSESAVKKLLGAGLSPIGAIAVGVTAGIGEELGTRGLLQPRLGKVIPNLAFVAAHAYQYGPDALMSVFLMGMILAFVRSRSNTTVAALVHGTYDFLAIMQQVVGV